MTGDNSEDEYPPFDEIGDKFTDERRALLTAVNRSGGDGIATPHLQEQTGVKTGSMGYYMDGLLDWGLVEIVGKEQAGPGSPSNVYSLTDRGQEFLERPGTRTIPSQEEVRQLEGRVGDLEQDVEGLKERNNQLVKIIQEMSGETQSSKS